MLPYFIAVRNGDDQWLDIVSDGNEHVIRARFADANFFVRDDIKKPLRSYLPRLDTLIFQAKLGSMLDKIHRIVGLVDDLAGQVGLDEDEACHGAAGGRAVQSRPGDQDGGRDDLAAGPDRALSMPCTPAKPRRWRRRSSSIICRALPAIRSRAARRAWWLAWPTGWIPWRACLRPTWRLPATKILLPSAARRWGWCRT